MTTLLYGALKYNDNNNNNDDGNHNERHDDDYDDEEQSNLREFDVSDKVRSLVQFYFHSILVYEYSQNVF